MTHAASATTEKVTTTNFAGKFHLHLNPHKTSAFNSQVFISLLQYGIVHTLVDPMEEKYMMPHL
jgi:hypothetical protein